MSEFVGRSAGGRPYSYPEGPRGAGLAQSFARNSASGPGNSFDIPAIGLEIDFENAESGPTGTDISITPVNTGILLISGIVCVKSNDVTDCAATVRVRIDGVDFSVPLNDKSTCIGNGFLSIPFSTVTAPLSLSQHFISIFVISEIDNILQLAVGSSTLSIQEVPTATG